MEDLYFSFFCFLLLLTNESGTFRNIARFSDIDRVRERRKNRSEDNNLSFSRNNGKVELVELGKTFYSSRKLLNCNKLQRGSLRTKSQFPGHLREKYFSSPIYRWLQKNVSLTAVTLLVGDEESEMDEVVTKLGLILSSQMMYYLLEEEAR
uniref:Uncharacterized protein n=1 Tax=Rhodnius prolixus TaxID=13249 RepID=T1HQY5_RHOPR